MFLQSFRLSLWIPFYAWKLDMYFWLFGPSISPLNLFLSVLIYKCECYFSLPIKFMCSIRLLFWGVSYFWVVGWGTEILFTFLHSSALKHWPTTKKNWITSPSSSCELWLLYRNDKWLIDVIKKLYCTSISDLDSNLMLYYGQAMSNAFTPLIIRIRSNTEYWISGWFDPNRTESKNTQIFLGYKVYFMRNYAENRHFRLLFDLIQYLLDIYRHRCLHYIISYANRSSF